MLGWVQGHVIESRSLDHIVEEGHLLSASGRGRDADLRRVCNERAKFGEGVHDFRDFVGGRNRR